MKKVIASITAMAVLLVGGSSLKAADAKELFEKNCASCHGKDGKGDTPAGKKLKAQDFTDAKVQEKLKDEEMVKAIKEGIKDKDSGKTKMKAFGDKLTDDDIKALVAYVRSFKK